MSEVVHKRMRTVKLLEILQQESDLDNPITTNELCRKLSEKGIATDRRTIPKDIEALNLQGYEIMFCKIGRQNAYYIDDRSFSLPELKILINAVQAANFITEKKTAELICKIAALGGNHQAEILTENIVHFNNHKHTNEQIYYTVSVLEKAIRAEQKVTFKAVSHKDSSRSFVRYCLNIKNYLSFALHIKIKRLITNSLTNILY